MLSCSLCVVPVVVELLSRARVPLSEFGKGLSFQGLLFVFCSREFLTFPIIQTYFCEKKGKGLMLMTHNSCDYPVHEWDRLFESSPCCFSLIISRKGCQGLSDGHK